MSQNVRGFGRKNTSRLAAGRRQRFQPSLLALEERQLLSTFTVTNTLDNTSAGSLRWAVGQANASSGNDTINFDAAVFTSPQTIKLGGTQLELSDTTGATTITAPATGVTVNGGGRSRVFQVDANVTATISGLTITGGSANPGAGILNNGTLTLNNATVTGNTSSLYGGGIANYGTATIDCSTISGNSAQEGGGIASESGNLVVTNSSVSNNSAIYVSTRSRLYGYGGGISAFRGSVSLANVTIANNTNNVAGLSLVSTTANLVNVTVAGNLNVQYNGFSITYANSGIDRYAGDLTMNNCLVAGNLWTGPDSAVDLSSRSGQDPYGTLPVAGSNNLIGTPDSYYPLQFIGSNNLRNISNPGLGTLGNYGGTTQTIPLLPGSPAIDAGNNALAVDAQGNPLTTDQRGLARIALKSVDIGAFELESVPDLTSIVVSPSSPSVALGLTQQFTATANYSNGWTADVTKFVTWSSDTSSVATIDAKGLASSQSAGTSGITATLNGVTSAVDTLTVTAAALTSISVSPSDPSILLGTTQQFTATGRYTDNSTRDITNSVTWASATPSVATINSAGLATGVSRGRSNITAALAGITSAAVTLSVTGVTVVDTTSDVVDSSDGKTSLREAIAFADLGTTSEKIVFDPAVFSTPQTITLTQGQLELSNRNGIAAIDGPGLGLTISGDNASRVFQVDSGVHAAFTGMTIAGGSADLGGGIVNYGTLDLLNCNLNSNSAGRGGAICSLPGTSLSIINSTISSNFAGSGGGVYTGDENSNHRTSATLIVTGSTISGNRADDGDGGGIEVVDTSVSIANSTFVGNSAAGAGGAIGLAFRTPARITNTTITGNSCDGDGGGGLAQSSVTRTTSMDNCIVSGNSNSDGSSDVQIKVAGSNNLIGSGGSGGLVDGVFGNIVGLDDPGLAPLGNYGGPTKTMAVLPGSPALDAGKASLALDGSGHPLTTDQRGGIFSRTNNGKVDIGAFQHQSGPAVLTDLAVTPSNPVTVLGSSQQLAALGIYSDASTSDISSMVSWTSSIDAVATIDATGLASPHEVGVTEITASLNGFAASAELTVGSLIVNSTSDTSSPLPGENTLRQAIAIANAHPGPDTITFDPVVFSTPQTITLTQGQLELSDTTGATTITAPAAGVTIDAGGSSRVLQVDADVVASVSGVTVSNGYVVDENGGGIDNEGGSLSLTGCTISGNVSLYGYGPGLANIGGTLSLTGCTISGNHNLYDGGGYGGGLASVGGSVSLTNCSVTGNSAQRGAGIYGLNADLTLTNSHVDENHGAYGGLCVRSSTLQLTNCSVSGNTSGQGAAGILGDNSTIIVSKSDITNNRNISNGGGGISISYSTLEMSDSTISGNSVKNYGSAGGGLLNLYGKATLTNCLVSDNSAWTGGGIRSGGDKSLLTISHSMIKNNIAFLGNGGGLSNWGTAIVEQCTFVGNRAVSGFGGAIRGVAGSTLTVTNSLISGNGSSDTVRGGGLDLNSTNATLTDCTITGNMAKSSGGGLYAYNSGGTTTLTNCTITGNQSTTLANGGGAGLSLLTGNDFLFNTIVAGNTGSTGSFSESVGDIGGLVLVGGSNNLIGNASPAGACGLINGVDGNIVGVTNPLLGPLGDYGGPTQTIPLLPGSPAINGGTSVNAPTTDQRGLGRFGGVDIGAFESRGFTFTPVTGSTPQSAVIGSAFGNLLAVNVAANNPVEPVDGGMVTFGKPSSGASATLSNGTVVISGGKASVAATANGIAGSYNVTVSTRGVPTPSSFTLTNSKASITTTSVGWGTVGTAALFTSSDGLRLLAAGCNTDLPWLNIQKFTVTLNGSATLTAADVKVRGIAIADYGPVTITGSGSTYTITLARPISVADRVTITISNDSIATFTRRLDVLPGDLNDDGVVDVRDTTAERNQVFLIALATIFGDINGDGKVDAADYTLVNARIKTKLP